MKLNISSKITGERVVLVPYRKHHVEKYNSWMSSKEIQELTSSEPLSLEEEYNMQETWLKDDDKLTFIVLRRDFYESKTESNKEEREIFSMVGDVNVFLYGEEDGPEDGPKNQAELEVMIVDKESRGYGFGTEAVMLIMNYAFQMLGGLRCFFVKIDDHNEASINMFKKLGFVQYEYIKAFKQVSLKLTIDESSFPEQKNTTNKYSFHRNFKLDIDSNY